MHERVSAEKQQAGQALKRNCRLERALRGHNHSQSLTAQKLIKGPLGEST